MVRTTAQVEFFQTRNEKSDQVLLLYKKRKESLDKLVGILLEVISEKRITDCKALA